MSRDMQSYQVEYEKLPFEPYQVQFRRKQVISQISKYAPKTVLEIGCGMLPLYLDMPEIERWCVVEPGDLFYENAKKQAPENVQMIHGFLETSIEPVKEMNIEFDYIVCGCLLHELPEPKKMLQAIMKVCGENTVVNINVPNAKSFHRLLAVEMGLISNVYNKSQTQITMQQSETYDLESLRKVCEENGFRVVNEGSFFIKPFTHGQMQACLDKGIFDERLLDGLNGMIKYMPEYGSEIFVECICQC